MPFLYTDTAPERTLNGHEFLAFSGALQRSQEEIKTISAVISNLDQCCANIRKALENATTTLIHQQLTAALTFAEAEITKQAKALNRHQLSAAAIQQVIAPTQSAA